MRYFSMFSGIGTGEKGIEQAFRRLGMHFGTITIRFTAETEEEIERLGTAIQNALPNFDGLRVEADSPDYWMDDEK